MSKSYKVTKKVINMGDHKGETVYTVRPYSCKRPKMSQRPYLRAFCKARKFHF